MFILQKVIIFIFFLALNWLLGCLDLFMLISETIFSHASIFFFRMSSATENGVGVSGKQNGEKTYKKVNVLWTSTYAALQWNPVQENHHRAASQLSWKLAISLIVIISHSMCMFESMQCWVIRITFKMSPFWTEMQRLNNPKRGQGHKNNG